MPETGKSLDGQGFGAGLGVDDGAGKCGGDGGGRNAGGAEVVGERLALLRKDLADEGEKAGLFEREFGEARGKAPADDAGIDIGRGREGRGRKGEERFGGAVHLDGDGEQAVVARAGKGGDAIGDFALDHQYGPVEDDAAQDWAFGGGVAGGQFEEDLRGDVVGEIAEDEQGLASGGGGGGEVEGEDVLLEDGEAAGWEPGAEMGGEAGVELDGEDVSGAGDEGRGDGAGAGTDFDDGAGGEIAERGGDALNGLRVVEEVLSEPGVGGHGLL